MIKPDVAWTEIQSVHSAEALYHVFADFPSPFLFEDPDNAILSALKKFDARGVESV